MRSLPIILTALLVVVSDPYKDIKYDEINIYEIEDQCLENCIGYTESEGWSESEDEETELASNSGDITIDQFLETVRQVILVNQPVMQ
jgi:hypothetical protein